MVSATQALSKRQTEADFDAIGDIIHLSAVGRDVIVLSSPEHIHELLDKRAAIYSDRPILPMVGQLVGFDQGVTMSQDGKWLREVKKLFASSLNSTAVKGIQRKLCPGPSRSLA